jgi:hypothetical protein
MTTTRQGPCSVATTRVEFGSAALYRARLFSLPELDTISTSLDLVPAALRRTAWNAMGSSMSTIGEPLYRNRERLDYYARCARAENRILYRHFRMVHETVAGFFERRYGTPVVFAEELAVPGFHVFDYPEAGEHGGGSWHFDALHMQVPWLKAHVHEIGATVNFTLPIEVPTGGTGMDLFDDEPGAGPAGGGVSTTSLYEPGVLLFTERDYWHRIGTSTSVLEAERRVTLQGHGVQFRGRLILFW